MPVTAIMTVTNASSDPILFVNTEHSGNNREIPSGSTVNVANCWVPWCSDDDTFPAHHIQIQNETTDTIMWYVWQDHGGDGDHVRASASGWSPPSEANEIPGNSNVGQQITITVTQNSITAFVVS